jgi:hypothetical protein
MTEPLLTQRLDNLAWRREQEGIYTDANLCADAAIEIMNLRSALLDVARFLGDAAAHFEDNGMPGWAGNCSTHRNRIIRRRHP